MSESADVGDVDAARVLGEAAQAIRSAGPLSAADLCQTALSLLPAGSPTRGELLALRTRCLILAGRPREAVESGRAALAAMPAEGDERTRTATAVVGALYDIGLVAEARELAERSVAEGTPSAFLMATRAQMIAAEGDVEPARIAIGEALAMPRRSAGEEVLVRSFLAGAAMLIGEMNEGLGHLDELRRATDEAGSNLRVYGLARRSWSLTVVGFVTAAAAALDETEAAVGAFGRGTYSAGAHAARIGLDWMRGEWDHVLTALGEARREIELSENATIGPYLQSVEIEIRTARGELREALALVKQPIASASTTRTSWATAGTLRASGDNGGARQLLRATIARPTDASWLPHLLLRLVELEHDAGDEQAAREAARRTRAPGRRRARSAAVGAGDGAARAGHRRARRRCRAWKARRSPTAKDSCTTRRWRACWPRRSTRPRPRSCSPPTRCSARWVPRPTGAGRRCCSAIVARRCRAAGGGRPVS